MVFIVYISNFVCYSWLRVGNTVGCVRNQYKPTREIWVGGGGRGGETGGLSATPEEGGGGGRRRDGDDYLMIHEGRGIFFPTLLGLHYRTPPLLFPLSLSHTHSCVNTEP